MSPANGLNPGEACIGLWRICHDYLEIKGAERQRTLARHDLLQAQMKDVLGLIIPYERPKLMAVEPEDSQINPMRVKPLPGSRPSEVMIFSISSSL
jgi:hypothetical protein